MKKNQNRSTLKKVVVHLLDGSVHRGFAHPYQFTRSEGIQFLNDRGTLKQFEYKTLKAVFFVRNFTGDKNHRDRKVVDRKPKISGLWVRLNFKDRERIDGIIPNDLMKLSDRGFLFMPADVHGNNQKIFVAKSALKSIEVLGITRDRAVKKF